MPPFDGAAFGAEIVEVVKSYVEREIKPLKARVAELEARQLKYSGTYRDSEVYRAGEMVSHAGSLWHCEATTASKPGTDSTWKLCVKRGEFSR